MMAADPVRSQIMEAFKTRMEGILKSSGYATNLGAHVFPWRVTEFEGSELPAMKFHDPENDRKRYAGLVYTNKLAIEMEIHPAPGASSTADAYDLLGDVMKAIGVDDRWSGLAIDTEPGKDTIDITQHDRIVGAITFTIQIEYRAQKWAF
jgi:hypothetical protein